jgi:hypothetical protein
MERLALQLAPALLHLLSYGTIQMRLKASSTQQQLLKLSPVIRKLMTLRMLTHYFTAGF